MSKLRKFANNFVVGKSVDKIFLALSKYLKILYKVPHISKFIKLFVFISNVQKFNTKFSISFASKSYRDNLKRHYRKNVLSNTLQYLNIIYPRLKNHLCSESFFVYNDTYHCIQIRLGHSDLLVVSVVRLKINLKSYDMQKEKYYSRPLIERRAPDRRIIVRLLSGHFINGRLYVFGLLISNLHDSEQHLIDAVKISVRETVVPRLMDHHKDMVKFGI
ncbi:hypothetical protein AGLY_012702 [Aphis glycines]|uniref:Uncharacterized protein n=1 Tax=Aphis glycines TaxID=307491 RepID=A0A6G0TAH2_APHGL|nr:hypothetical protein AGLY_012702 [Aphis glycines]